MTVGIRSIFHFTNLKYSANLKISARPFNAYSIYSK
jgi:hypothetical protein